MLLAATPGSETDEDDPMTIRVRRLTRQKAIFATIKAVLWVIMGLAALGLGIVAYQYPDVTGSGFFWEALFVLIALLSFRASYKLVQNIRAGRA